MEEILPYLQTYETPIYVLLGIITMYSLSRLFVSWQDWRGMVFGIEREIALNQVKTRLTVVVLLFLLILAEFMMVSFVAPIYQQAMVLPTPTIDLLATPTVTLEARIDSVSVTRTVTPTGQVPQQEGCQAGKIEWIKPKAGDEVSETVKLEGTVNVPNLGFYKYEYSEPESDVWNTIAAANQPKVNGEIGFWNTTQLAPGDYLLRLVVVDNENNPFPVCVVPVRVVGAQ